MISRFVEPAHRDATVVRVKHPQAIARNGATRRADTAVNGPIGLSGIFLIIRRQHESDESCCCRFVGEVSQCASARATRPQSRSNDRSAMVGCVEVTEDFRCEPEKSDALAPLAAAS